MNMQKLMGKITKQLTLNENLMKLLYYDTSDALSRDKVEPEQIYEMLTGIDVVEDSNGKIVSKNKRILDKMSSPDLMEYIHSEIRFYPKPIPSNGLVKILVFFEIIVHEDIEQLENCTNRSWEIYKEIYNTLNKCNAIGKFNFDNSNSKPMHFGKKYYGYMMYCTTYLSGRCL